MEKKYRRWVALGGYRGVMFLQIRPPRKLNPEGENAFT